MGALGAAISGLQSSQRWLDVISNNVSNSQTIAYKYSRTTFSDLISQGLGAASGPNDGSNLGGINPTQLGLGVTVGTIQTIFTQGAIQVTGNATDVAIQGRGFFYVKKGEQQLYTRSGNFTVDSQGDLVTGDGGLVQGWSTQLTRTNDPAAPFRITAISNVLDTSDVSKIGRIQIPTDLTLNPKATSANVSPTIKDQGVIIKGNLDEATPPNTLAQGALGPAGVTPLWAGGTTTGAIAVPNNVAIAAINASAVSPFAGLTPDHVVTTTVYDSVGDPRILTTWLFQVGDTTGVPANPPQWAWYTFDTTFKSGSAVFTGTPTQQNLLGGTGLNITTLFTAADPQVPTGAFGFISFNADGSLQTNGDADTTAAKLTQSNIVLSISNPFNTVPGSPPSVLASGGLDYMKVSLNFGTPDTFAAAGIFPTGGFAPAATTKNGLRDGLTGDYGNGNTILVGGVPTYIPNQSATVIFQDGYPEGRLTGVSVDATGGVVGRFTNGQSLVLAKLAMSDFNNQEGLSKVGGNYYAASINSGLARYGTGGRNGLGSVTGGAVEASNVDLTIELTNMILAQRMFESNARVVTSADKILDTLVNLGR